MMYYVPNGQTYGIRVDRADQANNSDTVDSLHPPQFFNNMGQNHSTQTDFNAVADFGARYLQGATNGPGTPSSQFYGFTLGLGNEYPYSQYALQLAIPRYVSTDKYLSIRNREAGVWQTWSKISAGYADTAGTAGGAPPTGPAGGVLGGTYPNPAFANNASYPVAAADGNGLKFWNGDDSYKISMGSGASYLYGPVTDYSIKTQMNAAAARGFTWGAVNAVPTAALSTTGNFQIAGTLGVGIAPAAKFHVAGGGAIIGTTGTTATTRALNIINDGQAVVNFGSYPGTWSPALQVQGNDNSRYIWMSPLHTDSGANARLATMGTGFDIYPGNTLAASFATSGYVGVGVLGPAAPLHVAGAEGDAGSIGIFRLTSANSQLRMGNSSSYSWIQSHNSKPLYVNELGNNIILNFGGGNVGIGTN
ncbi:MAG: hypothetical protein NTY45_15235, partial [Elusimicrobia bacterium]|nr:hypothetical protein [Elusimicrobiota bacterium]